MTSECSICFRPNCVREHRECSPPKGVSPRPAVTAERPAPPPPFAAQARLTRRQRTAAFVLHTQGGLSADELAEQLWWRFGFRSQASCAAALAASFAADAFDPELVCR